MIEGMPVSVSLFEFSSSSDDQSVMRNVLLRVEESSSPGPVWLAVQGSLQSGALRPGGGGGRDSRTGHSPGDLLETPRAEGGRYGEGGGACHSPDRSLETLESLRLSSVLYYTVLYCTVLYCTVLYCTRETETDYTGQVTTAGWSTPAYTTSRAA